VKFYGKKQEGKPQISNVEDYKKFFDSLQEGEAFEVTLIKSKDIRNLKMNNLYWWWLSILSKDSGYTKKELHSYFKEQFLCKESKINGKIVLDCESTADLSTKDYITYLENVSREAIQNFNCFLPDPDQLL